MHPHRLSRRRASGACGRRSAGRQPPAEGPARGAADQRAAAALAAWDVTTQRRGDPVGLPGGRAAPRTLRRLVRGDAAAAESGTRVFWIVEAEGRSSSGDGGCLSCAASFPTPSRFPPRLLAHLRRPCRSSSAVARRPQRLRRAGLYRGRTIVVRAPLRRHRQEPIRLQQPYSTHSRKRQSPSRGPAATEASPVPPVRAPDPPVEDVQARPAFARNGPPAAVHPPSSSRRPSRVVLRLPPGRKLPR